MMLLNGLILQNAFMKIKFSKKFVKQRDKAPIKIQKALDEKIILFIKDYQDPILNFHQLKGPLKDFYSINITGDWRAIFKFINKNEIIIFLILGTHSQLYN